MPSQSSQTESLTIPSTLDRLAEADDFLESSLRARNIPESLIADLAIAVTELVNNAIRHANGLDATKMVRLEIIYPADVGSVTVRVHDQGDGFDPEAIDNPLSEENLLREVGRGIFIVRSLMDEVTFQQSPTGGTIVTVRKDFPAPTAS